LTQDLLSQVPLFKEAVKAKFSQIWKDVLWVEL
jgi:hypothetical protein